MKTSEISAAYLDHMGTDLTVVNAARASFAKQSEWDFSTTLNPAYAGAVHQGTDPQGRCKFLRQADANLLRFLAKGYRSDDWADLVNHIEHLGREGDQEMLEAALVGFKRKAQHWAPFAHPQLQLRVEMPVFLARQMAKHQVGGVWSEVSRRYISDEPEFWFPKVWHSRPDDVKQGSGEAVESQGICTEVAVRQCERAAAAYRTLMAEGVAPEEARIVLPFNTMTTVVWTGSLLFWSRVATQRLDGSAQLAAQELGGLIQTIAQPLFPVSWSELVNGGLL